MNDTIFYIVYADRGPTNSRMYLYENRCESEWLATDGVHKEDRRNAIMQCLHFAPRDRRKAVEAAVRETQAFSLFGYQFKTMLIITRQEWREWPKDYKGKWDSEDAKLGYCWKEYVGRRTLMVGVSHDYDGCHLLTEGVRFEII